MHSFGSGRLVCPFLYSPEPGPRMGRRWHWRVRHLDGSVFPAGILEIGQHGRFDSLGDADRGRASRSELEPTRRRQHQRTATCTTTTATGATPAAAPAGTAALVPVCEQHVHTTATWPSWRLEGRVPERLWLGQLFVC